MKAENNHIIKKQNVHVNAKVQDAFALKKNVTSVMEHISTEMNLLFDELVPETEWLQIDKLNIDIGEISENELHEEFSKRVLQKLREQILSNNFRTASMASGSHTKLERFTDSEKTISAFLFFIENGFLPWWFDVLFHSIFEDKIKTALQSIKNNKERENLRKVLHNKLAVHRIIEQFQPHIYFEILKVFSNSLNENQISEIEKINLEFERVIDEILQLENTKALLIANRRELENLKLEIKAGVPLRKLKRLLLKIASISEIVPDILIEYAGLLWLEIPVSIKPIVKEVIVKNEVLSKHFRRQLGFDGKQGDVSKLEPDLKEIKNDIALREKKAGEKQKAFIQKIEEVEGVLISNAGLIIIAPFLPELFKQCKILEKDEIIDTHKAIALMHYVVYGNCTYREYDVLFNKVLCGLEENQTIEIVEELSEVEKNEIEIMLSNVIEYWKALKGTSSDGLREGFLLRKGKLSHKYDEWFLHVEQNTIDVLMQQLPWTIGFIKLPWMKKMIRTQWN